MALRRPNPKPPLVAGDGTQSAAQTRRTVPRESTERNSDFPWDDFDSTWYYDHNYRVLREDDRQIVEVVRDFFVMLDTSRPMRGIDVGTGTNLYPALTMVPLCDDITLYEYSASNISWLEQEIQCYSPSWDAYWNLLAQEPLYKSVDSPRQELATHAHVEKSSIFDLPENRWDIGTMFFTAESITSDQSEFHIAMASFIRSLRPNAPFAAAFMENSLGYAVKKHRFPAVKITADDVIDCLKNSTKNIKIYRTGLTNNPLRAGYGGMILVTGKVR